MRDAARSHAVQMIERPWGITAFSTASVQAPPDLARLRFQVSRLQQTPAQAFAVTSEAVGEVRRAIRERGVPDGSVQRSQLSLASAWNYGNERKFLGYQCQASFVVESRELDGVQQLLVDVVAAGANEIQGVSFDVADKPALRAEARKGAVAAARRKAQLYADAAGVRLGAVLHIDDVDPDKLGEGAHRSHSSARSEASAEDLAPGHVVVSAAVILGFAIAHD
jgi:uncharacterized protein YggE